MSNHIQIEAARVYNMLKMFQSADKISQEKILNGFKNESEKPCPNCGK